MVIDRKLSIFGESSIRNSISGDISTEKEPSKAWGRALKFQWESTLEDLISCRVSIPAIPSKQKALQVGQALSFQPAVSLLSELYDGLVLAYADLKKRMEPNFVVAIGLLAVAGLCDVSSLSIRITTEGKELVDFLMNTGTEDILWQTQR